MFVVCGRVVSLCVVRCVLFRVCCCSLVVVAWCVSGLSFVVVGCVLMLRVAALWAARCLLLVGVCCLLLLIVVFCFVAPVKC